MIYFSNDNALTKYFWHKIYKKLFLVNRVLQIRKSDTLVRAVRFTSKEELIQFKIDDIIVGDLVYDTYLRFRGKPTLEFDSYLDLIIEDTFEIYHYLDTLFKKNKYDEVYVVYTSYIYHGLLARIALKYCANVYTLGDTSRLRAKLTKEFPFHVSNFLNYKTITVGPKSLELASEKLDMRLDGKNDDQLSYMKNSAFKGDDLDISLLSGNDILIMAHDFFDSPHVYRWLLFPDFYEWITFVLDSAKKSQYKFFVKPHPNGIPENEEIFIELEKKYPNVVFIPKTVSNLSLMKASFRFVVTGYGTCAHEFPYKDIPIITCGDNPHVEFGFNHLCYNKGELEEFLIGSKILNYVIDKNEIKHFYYAHNLSTDKSRVPSDLELSSKMKSFNFKDAKEFLENESSFIKEFSIRYAAELSGFNHL